MKKLYSICGLRVCADFRFDTMITRSEKYICDTGTVDFTMPSVPEYELERLMQTPGINAASAENIYTADYFYTALLNFNGFMLHSSAVEIDGKAYLFSAPSGTGKSTHTSQWLKLFGDKACIINDDKPAIRFVDGVPYAYGTPWSGKHDISVNTRVPVGGIACLERGEVNEIETFGGYDAVLAILRQSNKPKDAQCRMQLLELLDKLISQVPVWKLRCNMEPEAAIVSYEAMSGKKWRD